MGEIEQTGEAMNRRIFFAAVAVSIGALAGKVGDALAYDNPRRRVRPRLRVHRRIRRPVFIRTRFGRPFWVVPVGLAAGWELSHGNRVVVVRETRFIEKEGVKTEVAIVEDSSGKTEQVEITREDSAENHRNLEGSVLDDRDASTPAIDSE
jgi:predicted methyltransferase MtxX (methanogen marker protein 4)